LYARGMEVNEDYYEHCLFINNRAKMFEYIFMTSFM
jgi:hypothetical protein